MEASPAGTTPRNDRCERLEAELLSRLERAELRHLLRHGNCESALLERLVPSEAEQSEAPPTVRRERLHRSPMVAIPVAEEIVGAGGRAKTRGRRSCKCTADELPLEDALVERLLCD